MFDAIEAFKKQFTRVEGGYLIYPSRKVGGKLVSEPEYEQLVADWEGVAGRRGTWKTAGAVVVAIAIWMLLSEWLSAPDWGDTLLIGIVALAVATWLIWASSAPRRLVRDREAVTQPRAPEEARREARGALSWPFVIFALLLSGLSFFATVTATDRTFGTWAWLIGSGVMLILYVWIGLKKMMDGMR